MSLPKDERIRENRLRRVANRQGFRLERIRRMDRRAIDFGLYRLVDIRPGAKPDPDQPYTMTMDEAARALGEDDRAVVAA